MKTIVLLLTLAGALMRVNAQPQTLIQGVFGEGITGVELKPITMRPLPAYAKGAVAADGTCTLAVDTSFPFIGEMVLSKGRARAKGTFVYIRPGGTLQVDFKDKKPSFQGESAKENTLVDSLIKKLILNAAFPKTSVEALAAFLTGYEREVDASDASAEFKSLVKSVAENETTSVKLGLLKSASPEGHRQLVKDLFERKITSTQFLSANIWPDKLDALCTEFEALGFLAPTPKYEERLKWVADPTVRSRYAVYLLDKTVNGLKWLADPVRPMIDRLSPYVTDPQSKVELARVCTHLAKLKADFAQARVGQPAAPFAFEDVNGNTVALKDFRGKFVILDVWNIHCGPCIRQIPFIKGMEKELAEKDVVFISISSDPQDAKDRWKRVVKAKEMAGSQLIMDKGRQSQFMTDYAIKGFPTFCVINPDGVVADPFFHMPEQPAFKPDLYKIIEAYRQQTRK